MAPTRRAAVDLGTVTSRLLVADVEGMEVSEVERRTVVTHLGEGLHASGRLAPDAIERVVSACEGFADDIAAAGAETVVVAATSAARDAANARELVGRLEALGLEPRVISGDAEARFAFVGATHALEDDDVLVADLGGGSTELIFGSVRVTGGERTVDIDAARSVDVGSRRVLDMFLHSDPPAQGELEAASAWTAKQMRPYFDSLRSRPRTLITLAGTGTTLSAVRQRLEPYDPRAVHGSHLSGGDIAQMREMLSAMTVQQRRTVVGMDPARADVIVAGALILETILGLAGLDSTVVSEHDILYGLVLEG